MTSYTQISYRNTFWMLWILSFSLLFYWQANERDPQIFFPPPAIPRLRPHVFNLTDFGAVGDGTTVNTRYFEDAVAAIKEMAHDGGAQLNVGPGRWLTAPFNVTSHMTLFLAKGATIVGSQDVDLWPILPALPSYGRGRELPGPRYGSLIHGQHIDDFVLTGTQIMIAFTGVHNATSGIVVLDVNNICVRSPGPMFSIIAGFRPLGAFWSHLYAVAGHNGSIDGQGSWWWKEHKKKNLRYTRGRLVEFMWSSNIEITDVTLQNSPFWHLHPYDCTNVTIRSVTILAPLNAPNTDGIDPDSCTNVLVENCYISVGDDAVAIKSGWDKYGIEYNRPCVNVTIRNIVAHSQISAGVSIGSEMSGGIQQVLVEGVYIWGSRRGVRIKTSPGRGGYVRNILYRNLTLVDVRVGIVIKTDYGDHPDPKFDPRALPIVANISFDGVHGSSVRYPVRMYGSQEVPLTGIKIRNMNVGLTKKKRNVFTCRFLQGKVIGKVFPRPCSSLLQVKTARV